MDWKYYTGTSLVVQLKLRIFNAGSIGPIYNKIFFKNEKKTLHNLWLVASTNAEPQCQMGKADSRGLVYLQIFGICRVLEPIPLGYWRTTEPYKPTEKTHHGSKELRKESRFLSKQKQKHNFGGTSRRDGWETLQAVLKETRPPNQRRL